MPRRSSNDAAFGYLKHFPVDFLKIDSSFVNGVLHDPIDRESARPGRPVR